MNNLMMQNDHIRSIKNSEIPNGVVGGLESIGKIITNRNERDK
jgi:hypothetical protein